MHISILNCNFGKIVSPKAKRVTTAVKPVQSVRCSSTNSNPLPIVRRSGNYQPCIWDNNYLQSLRSDYTPESLTGRAEKMKGDVVKMFNDAIKPLDQLELINHLQRLGLAYLFDEEIERTLKNIYNDHSNNKWRLKEDLHSTALEFRLLRQHGYHIPEAVFKSFTDNGSFKECLRKDVKGMLSLYEASYYSFEGECLMEEGWCFTNINLKELHGNIVDPNLAMHVKHAMELPLRWRMPWLEARWYIDVYERSDDMIPVLLQLAKLNFNLVQGFNQEELKILSGWWNKTGLVENLSFARDRLVPSFLWAMGITFEPRFEYCRVMLAKAIQLATVIDDIYDVYGTLDEIELFTDAVERWDFNEINQLPEYMKICFLALYNFVNEIVYDILKEQNINVLPHLKKAWLNLLEAYVVEAQWYASGHKPTLEEYLNNAWVSISGPLMTLLSYIFTTNPIKVEAIKFLESKPDILHLSSLIFRLADDYGTSSDELERGDVSKSIQCYMSDTGASEEVAREQMKDLMRKKWKGVNKLSQDSDIPLPKSYIETMINLCKTAHCFYNCGSDGFGVEDGVTKDRFYSLLVQPIPL